MERLLNNLAVLAVIGMTLFFVFGLVYVLFTGFLIAEPSPTPIG